jgi:6-pyruvoyltetrahydropterin/6-carboxytetrahydropterin synthase
VTYTLTKEIEFDAGHRVPGHGGACKNPHGHRYRVLVTVQGIPQPDGMVVDFGIVKRLLTEHVHDVLDHGMIVWKNDIHLLEAVSRHGWKVYIFDKPPTAEHIAEWCYGQLVDRLGEGLVLESVTVWETPTSTATYRQ